MALCNTSLRRLTCQTYRQSILKTFITSIGGPNVSNHVSRTLPRRTFTSSRKKWSEERHTISTITEDDFPINQINRDNKYNEDTQHATQVEESTIDEAPSGPKPQTESYLPWYLQHQSPLPTSSPINSSAQAIPPLPPNPPALLSPLLSHLSINLGMDYMTLLDLRTLDPPSALGANLIMILATARSEKHLHVSADKLCRWLRTEYKLSPYADGLLGRGEMKLKLKRRAKRSRLLSAVGSKVTADTELEEGIRTGWVCVNVGRLEGGELVPEVEEEVDGTFEEKIGGSRLVVQLLTEEKRGQIDLERLWTTVARKSDMVKGKALGVDAEESEFRVVYEAEAGAGAVPSQEQVGAQVH